MRHLFDISFVIFLIVSSASALVLFCYQIILYITKGSWVMVSMNYFFNKEDRFNFENWEAITGITNVVYFSTQLSFILIYMSLLGAILFYGTKQYTAKK